MKRYLRRIYRRLSPKRDPFLRMPPAQVFSQQSLEHYKGVNIDPRQYAQQKFLLTDSEIGNEHILRLCKRIASIDEVPTEEIKSSIFYVYFQCDSDAYYHVKKIIEQGGTFFPPLFFDKTEYRFVDRAALDTLKNSWANRERLSHLSVNVHENLCEALHLTRHLAGDLVEIGVFRGGSAFTSLSYLTKIGLKRKAWLFDTFDGFNYPEAKASADAIWTGTHKLFGPEETKRRIAEVLSETGQDFTLIEKNICQGELPAEINRIAVANIDVDIYEATLAAMEKVAPHIVTGGIMICEDSASTPGLYGAYVAMREFLETPLGQKFSPLFKGGQYFLLRLRD